MRVVSVAAVTAGLLPNGFTIEVYPGEKLYFLSVLADSVAAGSITLENATITIPAGTAFTIGAGDLPRNCESYQVKRRIVLNSTLGPCVAIFGPVDYDSVRVA